MHILGRRRLFSIVSLAALIAAIYFSFILAEPNYAMTATWLTFSLFTFVIGWPELAESISFLGSNIKLREVKNAINELKRLSGVVSKAILELIQCGDRIGGVTLEERLEIYNTIEKMLNDFDFTPQEVEEIQSHWHYWIERDYIAYILDINNEGKHPEIAEEKTEEFNKRKKQLFNHTPLPNPDDIRTLFKDCNGYSEVSKSLIDDFEYYKINKKHRNVEKWKEPDKWYKTSQ